MPRLKGRSAIKRVAIIGSGGAGKTTLARALGAKTGIPVVHLDRLYWRAGWVPTPHETWLERQRAVLEQECWIIDGNYGSTLALRLGAADTVIFLDTPRLRCLWRVFKRRLTYANQTRPDMSEGNPERLTGEFLRYVWSYPRTRRPAILQKLAGLRNTRVVQLRSDANIARFLKALGPAE